jgi:hypothetical protein
MPRTVKQTPPAKASPQAKRSPGKAKKPVPMRMKKMPLTIYAINFGPPFAFELYIYEKNGSEDGFTNGITKYMRGNEVEVHELFDTANFTQFWQRRVHGSPDIVAKSAENNYDRRLFLRYPAEGESTPETRATGLLAMKSFLQDPRFSRYPPVQIETVDITDFETMRPPAMDDYMMNCDIKEVVLHACEAADLNEDFKETFPDCAKCIWQSNHVGEFGRSLGFGHVGRSLNF